jgi:hypothetical protein
MTKILNQIIFFPPRMVARPGGILSTDLYKLYINPLLDSLQDVGIGLKIGNINVNNTGCADDIALLSTRGGASYSFRYHQNNNDETQYPNQC